VFLLSGGTPKPPELAVARLLTRLETETLVDHGTFDLLDDGGPQRASVDYGSSTEWLFAGDNAITVLSAAQYHVATVIVEVWDSMPEEEDDTWESSRAATVRLDSGDIEVNPLVDAEDAELVSVGPPGAYHVRAYVAGRAAVAAYPRDADEEAHGLERYLFRFWPDSTAGR
jgi:hypothetical protein